MLGTHPDLAHAVGMLSRFSSNPSPTHLKAMLRTFGYLQNTNDTALCFKKANEPSSILWFTDVDWAGDNSDARSTSGYVFFLSEAAFSWSSKKQDVTASSTMESEYTGLYYATLNAAWLYMLMDQIGFQVSSPINILCDNQAAIDIVNGGEISHKCSKHMNVKFHRVRDHIRLNETSVTKVDTKFNIADQFTKVLPKDRFSVLSDSLGFHPTPDLP